MTTEYILNKIESKARTLDDTSCLVVYCFAKFYPFISKPKILEAINKGAFYRGDKKYKSPFSLQN